MRAVVRSVRFRLALLNVAVLALIIFGCGSAVRYELKLALLEETDRNIVDHAHGILHMLSMPPPPDDPQLRMFRHPHPPPGGGRPDVRILDMSGYDADTRGGPLDSNAFALSRSGESIFVTVVKDGSRWRVYSTPQIGRSGKVEKVVQVEQSLDSTESELSDLLRVLITLIPLGLLAAGLGGAFLTDRSLRPVQRMAETIDRIQAKSLNERLRVSGDDEFARLGHTLNAMLARMQAAFDEQRRFAADASHELKTPLAIIKAKTSLALMKPRSAESYEAVVRTVDRVADQMSEIVQNLLLLAQADSGQLGQERSLIAVREVVLMALDGVWSEDGATPQLDLADPSPMVLANPVQLCRVLRNVIENAVRHTPAAGEVRISAEQTASGVEIVVRDTGSGIAPEHLPHLCERFYRVDSDRSRAGGGTGLGLAISKSIVDAHKGTMVIESVLGHGTTVRISIPNE